ncbi:RNA polymerase subunit sigma-24 [Alteriqipengyuania sp. NZ-12B]|uniref:RNA polymerase subunit sigma-24 n=1 Tax=Alteriqipengyuania abyssalis TaxID=2860200 RepID=A0ABS7PGD6_9SPHN|nr:RNA polymerase subunit sigma-24 [Alteriqipengyuania abyssalis]
MLAAARPRVVAALAARFRDLDLAEDAFSAACEAALREPAPIRDPAAWLYVAARRRALDALRRADREARVLADQPEPDPVGDVVPFPEPIPDDRLRLLFTCCHPALAREARIALALRVICGVSVARIARAFLVAEPAMYQRLTRAKAKIKAANIPFETPPSREWQFRVGTVLETLETALAIAYRNAAGTGETGGLAPEVERLAVLLAELMPQEAEAHGLLALVCLVRSREAARVDREGTMVPLSGQDVAQWDIARIEAGRTALDRATAIGKPGPLQVQAAIHLVHCLRRETGQTDWAAILRLYDVLTLMRPTPVVAVNRALALARATSAEEGLAALDAIETGRLTQFLPFHAVRADLLASLGKVGEARAEYDAALALDPEPAEARLLAARRDALGS